MHSTAATTIISVTLLATIAGAQRLLTPELGYFTGQIAVPVGQGYAEMRQLSANSHRFYTDQDTTAGCPDGVSSCCTTNDYTSFFVDSNALDQNGTSGSTVLYLNTQGSAVNSTGPPGTIARQQVYCNPTDGQLLYTTPGGPLPSGANNYTAVSYTPEVNRLSYGEVEFQMTNGVSLCLTKSGYHQLYCTSLIKPNSGLSCNATGFSTRPDFHGVAVGKYR